VSVAKRTQRLQPECGIKKLIPPSIGASFSAGREVDKKSRGQRQTIGFQDCDRAAILVGGIQWGRNFQARWANVRFGSSAAAGRLN